MNKGQRNLANKRHCTLWVHLGHAFWGRGGLGVNDHGTIRKSDGDFL